MMENGTVVNMILAGDVGGTKTLLGVFDRRAPRPAAEFVRTFATAARTASAGSANAAITAHLQSLEKTQKFQDETLSAMGIKDLRDQVNSGLIRASNETQRTLDELDRGLKAVDKASELKRKLEQRRKDGSRHD